MGSSSGSANPMFLSQGGVPMPNIPIAGQAGELKPQERGAFQEFLPEISPAGSSGYQIMPAGQGPNPSARGLTAEMFKYRSPSGVVEQSGMAGQVDSLRQQLAALQAQGGSGGGNGQFGAAGSGFRGFGPGDNPAGVALMGPRSFGIGSYDPGMVGDLSAGMNFPATTSMPGG